MRHGTSGAMYNTGGASRGGKHGGNVAAGKMLQSLAIHARTSRLKAEKSRLKGDPWRRPPIQYTAQNLKTRGYGNWVGLS